MSESRYSRKSNWLTFLFVLGPILFATIYILTRDPVPENLMIDIALPAGYEGMLWVVHDPEQATLRGLYSHLDFTQSPILHADNLKPFEIWHRYDAEDADGNKYSWSSPEAAQDGTLSVYDMGSVSVFEHGTQYPEIIKIYVGDPANIDALVDRLNALSIREIYNDPTLLQSN